MTILSKAQVAALNRDKVIEVLEGLGWEHSPQYGELGTRYAKNKGSAPFYVYVPDAFDSLSSKTFVNAWLPWFADAEGISQLDAYLLLTGQKLIDGEELAKLKATRTRRSVEAAKTIHGILSDMSPLGLYWAFLELGDDAKWRGFWEGLVGESYEALKERLFEKAARNSEEQHGEA